MALGDIRNFTPVDDFDGYLFEAGHDDPINFRYDDPTWVPTVYYDPIRFSSPKDIENLDKILIFKNPKNIGKVRNYRPLAAADLASMSVFFDRFVEERFLACGYAIDNDAVVLSSGRPPRLMKLSSAQESLEYAAAVAHIVISAVQENMGAGRPLWLQSNAEDVLSPLLGKGKFNTANASNPRRKIELGNSIRGPLTSVPLVEIDGIFVGCADFSVERQMFAAPAFQSDVAIKKGREIFSKHSCLDVRAFAFAVDGDLKRRQKNETGFRPEIFALWACQTMAALRAALSDAEITGNAGWRRNENRRARVATIKGHYLTKAQAAVENATDGFVSPHISTSLPPTMYNGAFVAFHEGWLIPPEDIYDDQRIDFEIMAKWAGHLRRWGAAIFAPGIAAALCRLVEDDYFATPSYPSKDENTAGQFIIDVLGIGALDTLYAKAALVLESEQGIPVVYDWSDPLDGRHTLNADDDLIVVGGYFLPVSETEIQKYTAVLERGEFPGFLRF